MYISEEHSEGEVQAQLDDGRIIQLYFERNEQAIAETARKYGNYCTAIARNILGNPEDAEECVNDTYLNTWNAIPPHKPQALSTFLGKIVRNLAFNRYQHNTAAKRGGGEIPLVLDELAYCVSDTEDVTHAYAMKELSSAINDFLGTLPKDKRNIFICRYWYTESIADIAARYRMEYAAVSMTLHRLRKKLHDYLIERGYEL